MVHPVTGKQITSYRKLMQDPTMSEVWMTAFGKDFGGMCQGDDKTKTTGTDAIFVMDPKDAPNIPKINRQPMPKLSSHIVCKRRTLIAFESQQAAI
jgi:hypothetical protein